MVFTNIMARKDANEPPAGTRAAYSYTSSPATYRTSSYSISSNGTTTFPCEENPICSWDSHRS